MQQSTNPATDNDLSKMPTPITTISQTEQKSNIPLIFTFFICMVVAAAGGYYVGRLQSTTSQKVSIEPTVSNTPTVTDSKAAVVSKPKTLEDIEFTYDTKKYTKTYQPYDAVNGNFANIRLTDVTTNRDIIIIEDISTAPNFDSEKPLDQITSSGGVTTASSFSPLVINAKTYELTADVFGEGFPTDDEGNCFQGGGVRSHFLRFSPEILVKVIEQYSETGCKGQETKRTESLTPEKRKEVIAILKSLHFK